MEEPARKSKNPGIVEALHVLTLFSFALAQPLFDVLADNPEFFIAHQATLSDLLAMTLAVILVPPLLGAGLVLLVTQVRASLGWVAYLTGICLLVTAIINPVAKTLPDSWNGIRILLALTAGIFAAWAYHRSTRVRTFVTLLVPAVVIFPALFLFNSDLRNWIDPDGVARPFEESKSEGIELGSDAPFLMIILDELPVTSLMNEKREINALRYPAFSSLAASSTWYRNATTVADNTTFALPAILTGRYPGKEKIPIYSHYPDNLMAVLGKDYRLEVYETATQMTPPELQTTELAAATGLERHLQLLSDSLLIYLHIVMPQKVTNRLPDIGHNWQGFGDPQAWLFQKWVKALKVDRVRPWEDLLVSAERLDKGQMIFFHSLLPHSPFRYLPSGQIVSEHASMPRMEDGCWSDVEQIQLTYYRHLLQVAFVDRLLGQVLDRLKEKGHWDDTLVVVLADHGISFRLNEPPRPLSSGNVADIISVPFFIKWPGQTRGVIDDRSIELTDLVPTLAEFLKIEGLKPMDGQSILSPSYVERTEKRVFKVDAREWYSFPVDHEAKYAALDQLIEWFGSDADSKGLFYPLVSGEELDSLVAAIRDEVGESGLRMGANELPADSGDGQPLLK